MKHLEGYIAELRDMCAAIPDSRTGKNTQYRIGDIGLAAFSLFFMQHPSFLEFQRTLHQNVGQDNTQTLFGMEKIPSDNHIRNILDGVKPDHFDDMFFLILEDLQNSRAHVTGNCLDGHTLIAMDGSEYFCSKKISCPSCSKRLRSDGNTEYFHAFLSGTVVCPGSPHVFCLPPEFITPQDGDKKQDCELKAAKRWLKRMLPRCANLSPIYLGDDLYAKQEICREIVDSGDSFLFTCKDSSHKTLAEFRKGLPLFHHQEKKGKGFQQREYKYSWAESLPLRDGLDALYVNWIDIEICNTQGKSTYHASFITNITPTKDNICELISSARARWKIENETFNVLKNNGYHLEHNYGHGKQTLSSVLVVLNLLAFSMHNACDVLEHIWQEARASAGPRSRLFIHLWSISKYHVFSSWNSLVRTIISGIPPPPT